MRLKTGIVHLWLYILFMCMISGLISTGYGVNVSFAENDPTYVTNGMDELDDFDEYSEGEMESIQDPLEGFNRAMFTFNDRVYFWALKPVARGYKKVMPQLARRGVRNFFHNLNYPMRFVGRCYSSR